MLGRSSKPRIDKRLYRKQASVVGIKYEDSHALQMKLETEMHTLARQLRQFVRDDDADPALQQTCEEMIRSRQELLKRLQW